ncbi:hypothetical protein EXE48_12090 [Halorubrum sp. ASP1]|uniref:hypothetical protein n=1 Tax=Halorubrum sp. ASP1 TaxID=2518114 RepID=UPI0010F692EA|nr:hypothetical protein [Halorubrum sp. ASP1]TKX60705.1 hypothetical protein EXE48_12090 [Halorubrum sp. ASP1]
MLATLVRRCGIADRREALREVCVRNLVWRCNVPGSTNRVATFGVAYAPDVETLVWCDMFSNFRKKLFGHRTCITVRASSFGDWKDSKGVFSEDRECGPVTVLAISDSSVQVAEVVLFENRLDCAFVSDRRLV